MSSSLQISQDNNIVNWYNKTLIDDSRYIHIKPYKSNINIKFKCKFTLTKHCLYTSSLYNNQITSTESILMITLDILFIVIIRYLHVLV